MKIKRRNKNKENTKKAVKGKRELNFKYNWKIYLSFLKNYKLLFSVIVFTILINEILNISERYLFKIIIDKSNDYGAKTINLDVLINILIWIAII